ncbi:MAG: hypothetical protein PHS93_07145 [Candidatus Omnitrophica bacterium]|nr:hypothetical protein [Candidatus Omnitrophota bacterium]MDD5352917.1 hypothetical protein [Candidatus Omnitrophota bacterium]MDD5550516.1 hypothetical protein [Candidatus Omnitrophota bacterium]
MKKISIFILVLALGAFSGCASLHTKARGASGEKQAAIENDIPITIGFNLLEDKRPQEDVSYMTSVREKVSGEILKMLRDEGIFDEIHFPALEKDSIVICGEIKKFNWVSFDTMISYIPGLNVLPFFGLPSTRVYSEAEIYLELKKNRTNDVIFGFIESYKKETTYNIYNFKTERANADLASCFDVILKRIKEKILLNRIKILEVAGLVSAKTPKPSAETKSEEAAKSEPEVKSEQPAAVPAPVPAAAPTPAPAAPATPASKTEPAAAPQ